MIHSKPLRFTILMYELLRLAAFFAVYFSSVQQIDNSTIIPLAPLMSPNVLFVLMALFLFLDVEKYGSFLPLYAASKLLFSVTLLVWLISSFHVIINAFFMDSSGIISSVGLSVLTIPADFLSVLMVFVVQKRHKKYSNPDTGGL